MSIILIFATISVVMFVLLAVVLPEPQAVLEQRLNTIQHPQQRLLTTYERFLTTSFFSRVIQPFLNMAWQMGLKLTPLQQKERLKKNLQKAGWYSPERLDKLLLYKGLGLIGTVVTGLVLLGFSPALAVLVFNIGLIVCIWAPDFMIRRTIALRQQTIIRALPDILDLICACVEAGLTMDGAIQRLCQKDNEDPLSQELNRYLGDVALGAPRRSALEDMADRCGVDDLQNVVAALVQADSMGVGVKTVLSAQAVHLRTRRKQRAQEAAMKAPVKMLFPLVAFIFPSIFIVTLGPAVLKLMDTFMKN
jgi:tight adherence protein C